MSQNATNPILQCQLGQTNNVLHSVFSRAKKKEGEGEGGRGLRWEVGAGKFERGGSGGIKTMQRLPPPPARRAAECFFIFKVGDPERGKPPPPGGNERGGTSGKSLKKTSCKCNYFPNFWDSKSTPLLNPLPSGGGSRPGPNNHLWEGGPWCALEWAGQAGTCPPGRIGTLPTPPP